MLDGGCSTVRLGSLESAHGVAWILWVAQLRLLINLPQDLLLLLLRIQDMLPAEQTCIQLLHTVRHSVTARLGSMLENRLQGMLAIEAAQQEQQELSEC